MVISIHALREEGDWRVCRQNQSSQRFLSTPSARRATSATTMCRTGSGYFYPRPPRGGRRNHSCQIIAYARFLSTPSARRATRRGSPKQVPRRFLSTPSARRATEKAWRIKQYRQISIHALREEGDFIPQVTVVGTAEFLSTPSARRATQTAQTQRLGNTFLSTPSARRATFSASSFRQ